MFISLFPPIPLFTNPPLIIGTDFQAVSGPSLQYCPKLTSKKKIGRPAKPNIRKYGMRKAPEKKNNCETQNVI